MPIVTNFKNILECEINNICKNIINIINNFLLKKLLTDISDLLPFLAILCILAAILRGYYYYHNDLEEVDPNGFGYSEYSYGVESALNYFTYMLLLNTLIPISLIITLEVVKLIQGRFMTCDKYAYSHARHRWLTPNSVSLNEECGLVKYIFSDKTGTLII